MAKDFQTHIDLNGFEVRSMSLENLASAPGSPGLGRVYYNTTTDVAEYWDGTQWIALAAGAGISATSTDTLTNKTISSLTNFVVADEIHFEIRNDSGVTLTKGTPVYVTGFNVGQDLVTVDAADATSSATMQAIGLIEADIANNATGGAVSMGVLEGLDTSAYTTGDVLYVSETTGALTGTPPTGSALVQEVGVVMRSNPSTGSILVSLTETDITGFAYTLLNDPDAATARATLGITGSDLSYETIAHSVSGVVTLDLSTNTGGWLINTSADITGFTITNAPASGFLVRRLLFINSSATVTIDYTGISNVGVAPTTLNAIDDEIVIDLIERTA